MTDRREGGADEDAKRKFREALERKRGHTHRTEQAPPGAGGVQGPETHGGRRTFRRKTG
ncbi:DUF5302 domain-containing protein [Cellulomonas sp. APG4]|uniref:DUF5302 domain-containing protein n=1 Tax=Cellulomonas sp. APG4 TaxID=1538656 RepID=UPI00137951C3|nr:DUF5302 domain-containing protein [Cellulomonas sp. APG4]NCT92063.1 DUF5302 domain-containing protein [Cellulomonas sp. APG4]